MEANLREASTCIVTFFKHARPTCFVNFFKFLFRRIDGLIKVISNVDPTFYSLVGFGQFLKEGDHYDFSFLENPYIPY